MSDDPYKILGVERSASAETVRRAYLKLVKELHPDVNPSPEAEVRFKTISAAYDLLGDPEKRAQYDRGEINADGEPIRPRWHAGAGPGSGAEAGHPFSGGPFAGGMGGGFSDFFSDAFGGQGGPGGTGGFADARGFQRRGRDLRYTMEVSFLEAALGTKKRVTLPEGGALELAVPAGVRAGQVLRLKGKGGPGFANGAPGDALVEIKVARHPQFERKNDDILVEIPVTLDEAVLGAKIEVPTLTGRVQLQVPKGTSSGKTFRLRGKGVKPASGTTAGDQLVTVRIVMPDSIDEELTDFFSKWRKDKGYDAGR